MPSCLYQVLLTPRPRDAPDRVVAAIASAVDQGPIYRAGHQKIVAEKVEDQRIISISGKISRPWNWFMMVHVHGTWNGINLFYQLVEHGGRVRTSTV